MTQTYIWPFSRV